VIYGQLTAGFVTLELKYPADDTVRGIRFLISTARYVSIQEENGLLERGRNVLEYDSQINYRGADKSLARSGWKQNTSGSRSG
jgi:hypothetical protein